MATQMAKENGYAAAFRALREKRGVNGVGSSWVERLRESAFASFEQLGFPTPAHEEWKYTNVAPLAKIDFEPASLRSEVSRLTAEQVRAFSYEEADGSRLVFVNGIYYAELSSLEKLPQGIVAMDLADALGTSEHEAIVREQLARSANYMEDAFTALNTAFMSSGALLLIPKGVRVDAPIHLLFLSDPQGPQAVSFPRVLIVSEQGSEATVIESYASAGAGVYWTNAVVEVVLAEGARLELYKVQDESAEAFHIATTAVDLKRNSNFETTTITLGARLSRHGISVALAGDAAECRVDGLYLVTDNQHADTHSLIDHREPHGTSKQLYKGILDGKSRAVFNGKVFVHRDAQQTDATQTNKNLLLSNGARVDTKPQLEIFADDVKCAHGAAIGQLDEEALFYLASRGMHPDLARNLLTYGFAEEVIDKIKIESIKAQLDEAVLNRLHARLEV
jgi:Fe-S cluster assembly protein SufD